MVTPTELSVLLRLYTNKQNTPTILMQDFSDYLQKYARHYIQETPELVMYLENTAAIVMQELEKLQSEGKITITLDVKGRKLVFVPHFFIDRVIQRYRELEEHPELPFTVSAEIPQNFPPNFIKPVHITSDFTALGENGERTNTYLNQLIFPDDTSPMIYPASLSPEKLLDLALSKIRFFLRKEESKEYIQKRLMIANPGKELTIKNFVIQFLTRPSESLSTLKHAGEAYLFWSYLCSYMRQDFLKKAEKTSDDVAVLQAVYITEYLNNFYKNQSQQGLQRETALKNLELCFQKPPYYFDMDAIMRFTDSRGVPLLGQYKSIDLEEFIKEKSGDELSATLPQLLIFKTEDGKRYFVLKEKLMPLAVRLCNDVRKLIKEDITHEWFTTLSDYRIDDAMKNQSEFEKKIIAKCRTSAPILHSLLSASFIPLFFLEGTDDKSSPQNGFKMFDHGRLLPYHALLMLDRQELLTDARILLPFWYTLPVLSSFFAFLHRPRQKKDKMSGKKTDTRANASECDEIKTEP
jgi:hypothetical protein